MKRIIPIAIIISLFASITFGQKSYTLSKAHSRVGFSVTHFGISQVEGNFKAIDATLRTKGENFTDAIITFTADVNTINTDVDIRDNNLKSSAYFDAAKFPSIDFKSTSFKKINGKKYKLTGSITIHGVTNPITFNVLYNGTAITSMGKPTAGFTITGKLNRLDFGIGSNSPVTSGISNEIELRANVEFTIDN